MKPHDVVDVCYTQFCHSGQVMWNCKLTCSCGEPLNGIGLIQARAYADAKSVQAEHLRAVAARQERKAAAHRLVQRQLANGLTRDQIWWDWFFWKPAPEDTPLWEAVGEVLGELETSRADKVLEMD